jgi:hypothetical protein
LPDVECPEPAFSLPIANPIFLACLVKLKQWLGRLDIRARERCKVHTQAVPRLYVFVQKYGVCGRRVQTIQEFG